MVVHGGSGIFSFSSYSLSYSRDSRYPSHNKKKKSSRFFMLIIVLIPLIIFSFKPNQVYTKWKIKSVHRSFHLVFFFLSFSIGFDILSTFGSLFEKFNSNLFLFYFLISFFIWYLRSIFTIDFLDYSNKDPPRNNLRNRKSKILNVLFIFEHEVSSKYS
jgi:hypothetical protein